MHPGSTKQAKLFALNHEALQAHMIDRAQLLELSLGFPTVYDVSVLMCLGIL